MPSLPGVARLAVAAGARNGPGADGVPAPLPVPRDGPEDLDLLVTRRLAQALLAVAGAEPAERVGRSIASWADELRTAVARVPGLRAKGSCCVDAVPSISAG